MKIHHLKSYNLNLKSNTWRKEWDSVTTLARFRSLGRDPGSRSRSQQPRATSLRLSNPTREQSSLLTCGTRTHNVLRRARLPIVFLIQPDSFLSGFSCSQEHENGFSLFFETNGSRDEIRTHGTFRFCRFQDDRLKPLGHSANLCLRTLTKFEIRISKS